MVSNVLHDHVVRTTDVCRRWKIPLSIPDGADVEQTAMMIRTALMRAAKAAAAPPPHIFLPDDHAWSHDGMRGLSLDRMREEAKLAEDSMASAGEEWGIVARVEEEESSFDVPLVIDLDQDSARNILSLMEGREGEFVNVEAIGDLFEGRPFSIALEAGNWASLRDNSQAASLPLDMAFLFRRPVVWDLMRAELSELPAEPLPAFDPQEFYSKMARSTRFDLPLMASNRAMVEKIAKIFVAPSSLKWAEWHPAVCDLLDAIGDPKQMDGISILLNFVVEEPLSEQPDAHLDDEHPEHTPFAAWTPVGFHNVLVCYGLHPLSAVPLLELVRLEPTAFFDLVDEDARRYRLLGASAVPDALLSSHRASLNGRSDGYDLLVAGEAAAAAEEASRPPEEDDEEDIRF